MTQSPCVCVLLWSPGQQSLSEEVSERTQSRLLRLEKENQRLIRTIEELQTASVTSSPQHSHYQDQEQDQDHDQDQDQDLDHFSQEALDPCTKLAEETSLPGSSTPTRIPKLFNGVTNEGVPGGVTCKGDSKCPELEEGHSEALLTETLDFEDHEKGQLDEWASSENIKELFSDPVGNNSPCRQCFDAPPLGAKSGRLSYDSVMAGLTSRSCYQATKQTERLEAKCRALDTENQRLQASLDNSGGFKGKNQAAMFELVPAH